MVSEVVSVTVSDTNFLYFIYPVLVPVLIFSTKFFWLQYYYSIWNFSGTGSGSYFPYQFFLILILIFGAKIFWYQIPVVLPRFTFSLKNYKISFIPPGVKVLTQAGQGDRAEKCYLSWQPHNCFCFTVNVCVNF